MTKMARWKMDKRVDDTTKEKKRVKRRRRGGGKRPAEKEKGRVNECRLHGGVMNDTSLGSHSSICPSSPLLPLLCPSFLPFPFFLNSSPPSFLLCHPGFHVLHFLSLFFSSCLHFPYFIPSYFFHSLLFPPCLPPFSLNSLLPLFCHFILFNLHFLSLLLLSFTYSAILLPAFLLSPPPSFFLPPLLFPSLSPLHFLPSSFVYSSL